VKTWKQESSNCLTGFHNSNRESRAPPPLYNFDPPLYEGGGFLTFHPFMTNPILMDRTLATVQGVEIASKCAQEVKYVIKYMNKQIK